MTDEPLGPVLRHLRRVLDPPGGDDATDRTLLEQFAARRDEAAFALLVRRHGPLVLGVARRVLRDPHDAEDVFQATFLVLARRAASTRWQASVGNWLYGVAYRLAAKARAGAARRRAHERRAGQMAAAGARPAAAAARELGEVLDEELRRLPESDRQPLLLCYLEGETRDQAARRLGWSLRTLERRLGQARERLRGRLARRGVTLSAALLSAELSREAVTAAVPAGLAAAAVKAAGPFAVGKAAAEGVCISGGVIAMAESMLKGSWVRPAVVAVLALALSGAGGAGLFAYRARAPVPRPADERVARVPLGDKKPGRIDPDEEAAVKALEKLAGNDLLIIRDDQLPGKPVVKVQLFGPKVTDAMLKEAVKELQKLRQLRELGLLNTRVTEEGFKELGDLPGLPALSLYATRVTGAGMRELSRLKQLRELDLGATWMTDAELTDLKELRQLQTLNVSATRVTDAGLKGLRELKQLRELDLSGTEVTDAGLGELRGMPLRKLRLHDARRVGGVGLEALKELKELRELDFRSDTITDAELKCFKELKQLQVLHIRGSSPVTGAGLKELRGLSQLQTLSLCCVNLADAGLKELKEFPPPRLQTLVISSQRVTDVGLRELAGLKQIRVLDVNAEVSDAAMEELAGALPKCSVILTKPAGSVIVKPSS